MGCSLSNQSKSKFNSLNDLSFEIKKNLYLRELILIRIKISKNYLISFLVLGLML